MGYFKKFISQMLCILIIVGVLIGGSSATAQETYTESEKINYNENIDLVKKLGILEERENPEISYLVTRGEFAKIILKTMGYGQLASNATYKPIFSDVTEETPYYSYILWANELGYLTGVGNGKFAPDEYLTGEQVIKSFVSAIGYGILAEEKGGYPEGYMLQANKLGILDNVELQMGYPITYYNLANILCNTLTVDFMVKSEFTNDSSYEISKKSNILSKIFNLVQYKGVVTSTEMTNLVKNTRSSKNQIEINDKAYSIEGSYNYLIGQKVDYYVNTEKDNEIKFILEKSKYNIISTVNAMNIDDYKDQTYYYTKSQNEGKIYEKNISGAYILYNGKAWSNGIEKEMLPKSGKVTFIDNNCDGKQDVVIVTNYRTVVVNDVDNEKKVIGDTIEPAYPIEVNDSDFLSIKDTENNEIDFNKISKNDILSVASSKDNDIVNIIVSKNSVTGIVNGMKKGAEGTLKSIKVDEKEYKINNDTFESDSNIIGMKYRIGLDFEGRAASINKKNESSNNIGYLINASGEHENKNVEFKVFDISADKVKIMNGAEKIKIDKKMCKNNKTILNALKKFKPGASDIEKDETKVLSEIISYKLNENEEIVEIDTPYNYLTDSVGEYENIPVPDDEDSKSLRMIYHGSDQLQYKTSSQLFGGKVPINGATTILRVPTDAKNADDKSFTKLSPNYFGNDENYTVEAYSISNNDILSDILIVYENSSAGIAGQNVGLVKSITEVVDTEGEIVKKLEIINSYRTYTLYAYDVNLNAVSPINGTGTYELGIGDTVKFNSDSLNRLGYIRLIYDASAEGEDAIKFTNPSGSYAGYHRYVFGKVYEKEDNVIAVTRKSEEEMRLGLKAEDYELFSTTYFAIIEYDRELGEISAKRVSAKNINDFKNYQNRYSKVFIHTSHSEGYEIIIYK